MGFAPSVVDKAIEENVQDHQQLKTEESFDDGLSRKSTNDLTANHNVKEEPDAGNNVNDEKKASLLKMDFSLAEVDFALNRLGKDAVVGQLMDFIFVARMARNISHEHSSDEAIFGIIEKMLQLFEMGFTENEISTAFEICGSEASPQELADSIFDPKAHKNRPPKRKLKDEVAEDTSSPISRTRPEAKKRNSSSAGGRMTAWQKMVDELGGLEDDRKPIAMSMPTNPSRTLTGMVAKPPYFLYGNAMSSSHTSWVSITQFMHSIHPEFVNTETYSALSRIEGYVHNLPTGDRFIISPRGPLSIQEAIPHTKKWWPVWDNRKQLIDINTETSRISHFCERLERVSDPPPEQRRELIQQLQDKNLVWVGRNKLSPLEPEQIEVIMGYPLHHTRVAGFGAERLKSLKQAFQTDTLGYHLSVLKKLYPEGLTVMSCFDGIGGAEVALHRLGIRLKGMVSVEANEIKRKIVKRWWESSGQTGELVQVESIHKLKSSNLEELVKKFHGFDLIVGQNSYCSEDSSVMSGFDFSMFAEFVRVLQRVRSIR
ncbi:DNA (cytosine-5-)-methyltransferase [Castilleja foliolosa]|uniref:DNA (Cytosine-5-)-methyltransferase n=1 Tax=Castilleja foliolosa TaxID=1961234 RepID=A0ABD3C9Z0_9LAMI